jgi:hypothetical protein
MNLLVRMWQTCLGPGPRLHAICKLYGLLMPPCLVHDAKGGLDYKWDQETANAWPACKDKSPFGQLPMMTDGDITISQV